MEREPGLVSTGLLGEQSRVNVPLPPQDKWEELVSLDSHLEILGHVSLMTLDTIMNAHSASRAMSRQTGQ